ncbi:MAG TPA: VTT domain-containing protein [Acidimicrobiales bacterium]|jgi:membrane-associated protein|nr:VTT domain-containing protein [Acidimicrobiales bacterium]
MLASLLAAGGLLDPEHLIEVVGLIGIFAIVFAESGLLVGFFLPGDSLLFTAGFLASAPSSVDDSLHLPLGWLLLGCFVAAVTGDQVGYLFGRRVGPALFRRPDSRFFKQDNVDKAQGFFDRYGAKTIVLARFVPIVRTFAPIVAGVSRMNYRTFVTFNVVGGFAWSVGITLLGYFLGQVDVIEQNLELAILSVVAISIVPIALELWKAHKEKRSVALDVAHDLLDPDLEELAEEAVHPDGRLD